MSKPQIRGWFGGWTTTTYEHAMKFAKSLYDHMVCPKEKRIELINTKHLKGVEFHADR